MEFRRLAIGAAVATPVGWLLGDISLALLVGLIGYLFWHGRQLMRILSWLTNGDPELLRNLAVPWRTVGEYLQRYKVIGDKNEENLRDVLVRFEHLADTLPEGTVVLDKNDRIVWVNAAGLRLLGLRAPDDLGKPITNFVRVPEFALFLESVTENDSLELASPANTAVLLSLRILPYDEQQRLLSCSNITRLHSLEGMRSDFVANVSHELRSPLTVIVGYLDSLSNKPDLPEALSRPLLAMSQQAQRMTRIVEDLLGLSRIEGDPGGAPRQIIQVAEMVGMMTTEASSRGGNSHQFTLNVDSSVHVLGEYNELYSAFSNLITNAMLYSPSGSEIIIHWYCDENGGHFRVTDRGVGIDQDDVPRLTERFYRVDRARSRELGGTGLGLAIVKHILLRHDATLTVESRVGEGSAFTCHFPAFRVDTTARRIAATS